MANFELERYTGYWFEIVRDRATPGELLGGCVHAKYTGPMPDGSIEVLNSGYNYNNGWKIAQAAIAVGEDGSGSLVASF